MPEASNGTVVIPKWFLSFLSVAVSALVMGGIPWAWALSRDVAIVRQQVQLNGDSMADRIRKNEQRLDGHEDRLRALEVKVR